MENNNNSMEKMMQMQTQMMQMQMAQQMQEQANRGKKDKTTAILLCLFLGGIGGHKYYEGKIGMGILYTIFVWTFIPCFLSIIDFFILLGKDKTYFPK